MSGSTAQDAGWKSREQSEEARYAREKGTNVKEQAQLSAIRAKQEDSKQGQSASNHERGFEGGFGGQEDLEDRYATTSGEH